jgi:hypothetical protein
MVMQASLNYIAASEVIDAFDEITQVCSRMPFLKDAARWLNQIMMSAEMVWSERTQVELYKRLGGPSNKAFKAWRVVYYFGIYSQANTRFLVLRDVPSRLLR